MQVIDPVRSHRDLGKTETENGKRKTERGAPIRSAGWRFHRRPLFSARDVIGFKTQQTFELVGLSTRQQM